MLKGRILSPLVPGDDSFGHNLARFYTSCTQVYTQFGLDFYYKIYILVTDSKGGGVNPVCKMWRCVMTVSLRSVLFALLVLVVTSACAGNGGPTGPTPPGPSPPTATLQLLDLKIGIADSSGVGAPLTGPISVGTRVRYTLKFGSPTGMSGLTATFKTICNGGVVYTDSLVGGAGAGSDNGVQSEFTSMAACNYTVQASISGATPAMLEKTFEAK